MSIRESSLHELVRSDGETNELRKCMGHILKAGVLVQIPDRPKST